MSIHTEHRRLLVACLLAVPLLITSCAHKSALKRAKSLEASGNYVEAALQDLEALDRKPSFEEALIHLRSTAPLAYRQLIDRASRLEGDNQWIEAIQSYEFTETLLTRFGYYGVILESTDIPARIARARQQGTNYYFRNAESCFIDGDHPRAIELYRKVVSVAGYFQDTKQKLWQAHIYEGEKNFKAGQYRISIEEYFKPALEYAEYSTDESATRNFIAEAHYQWGDKLASEGDNRGALEQFTRALEMVPGYRDAEERRAGVYEEAVQRVAILPFRNATAYGFQYSNLLTEQLTSHCINANLEFAVFATRDYLAQVLQEHELAMAGAVDPATATRIGRLEGIDQFITGSVTQISEQTTSPKYVEKIHTVTYTEPDSTGKAVRRSRKIQYREYSTRRIVQVSASFQVVDVETGRIIKGDDFTEEIVDEVHWVKYKGNVKDLPKSKQMLLDAPGEPKSADMLTSDAIREIAKKMSGSIIKYFR